MATVAPIYLWSSIGKLAKNEKRDMKYIIISLTFFLVCGSVHAAQEPLPALAPDEMEIAVQAVVQPLNRFLFIRRGESLYAVIFVSFLKDNKGKFILYRAYQNSPSGWQQSKEDTIGTRELKWWETWLGRLGIHTPPLSRIKPLELKGFTLMALASPDEKHAVVHFGGYDAELDETIEIAPTPWREIKEVNLTDARLKWYRAYGPELTAKIDELWK
jgi:hypothetical protein